MEERRQPSTPDDVELLGQFADALKEQVAMLAGQRDALQDEMALWQQREEGLSGRVQGLGQQVHDLEERIRALEGRRRDLEQHVSDLRSQQARLESYYGSEGVGDELRLLLSQRESLKADVEWWEQREQELSGRVQALAQQIQELDARIRAYEQARQELERRLAALQEQERHHTEHETYAGAQKEIASLAAQRDALQRELEWWQRKEQGLARRVHELEESLFGMERMASQWKAVLDLFTQMGLGAADVSDIARGLQDAANRQNVSVRDVHHRLLWALRNSEDPGYSELVGARRTELEELERALEQRRSEEGQLQSVISRLRQERQQVEASVPGARQTAALEVQRAGEEAAASVREGAELLRSQLDELLRDAMDIAGRAAQVDADVRSKEWLSKLLSLLEGENDVRPNEVRALGLSLLEAFLAWFDSNPDATPAMVKSDTERALRAFQSWVS